MDTKILMYCLVTVTVVLIMAGLVTLLPLLYDYRVTVSELQVMLLGRWPCRRLSLKDVIEIRKVRFAETVPFRSPAVFFAERWGNRLFKPTILIRRNRGITKMWFVTPKEPDTFIIDIKNKLQTLNK